MSRVSDEQLLALLREGRRVGEIAAQVGLTPAAVQKRAQRLRALGLVPSRARALGDRDRRILELRQTGLRSGEIATRLGLSPKEVALCLSRLRRRGLIPARWRRTSDHQIVALAKQGLGGRAIAAQLGLTLAAVNWRLRGLRRRGLLPYAPPPPRSTLTDEGLLSLHRAGLQAGEIAERTGLAASTIQRRLRMVRRRGAAVRPAAGRRQHATDEDLVTLARRGMPMQEIAARVGLGMSELYKRMRALRRRGRLPANQPAGKPANEPVGETATPPAAKAAGAQSAKPS